MSSPSTGTRPEIEAQLNALAEKHIAAFDSYTQVVNDPTTGHTAAYTVKEGLPDCRQVQSLWSHFGKDQDLLCELLREYRKAK